MAQRNNLSLPSGVVFGLWWNNAPIFISKKSHFETLMFLISHVCALIRRMEQLYLYFIIFPNSLRSLLFELEGFSNSGKMCFATSKSRWMTRDIFLIWVINLINWMTEYRKTLDSSLRDTLSLLILDGHGSWKCPLALQIL